MLCRDILGGGILQQGDHSGNRLYVETGGNILPDNVRKPCCEARPQLESDDLWIRP